MDVGWQRMFAWCCVVAQRTGLVDSSTRVAPSFCLGCIAWRRPSNWLLRRFGRGGLSRSLETTQGDSVDRTATREGDRTAPNVICTNRQREAPLCSCVDFSGGSCAMFHSAWTEDRATVGTDPSAEPGAKTEGGRLALPTAFLRLRDWHESDKSRGAGGWPPVL